MIVNESFAKFTGLKHPVGETLRWGKKDYRIVGVVQDMLMESPYEPVFRAVFPMSTNAEHWINIRINPRMNAHEAIAKIEPVFKTYNPSQPFEYSFTDEETRAAMQAVFFKSSYTLDPHGAIGYLGLKEFQSQHPEITGIFLETAHPAKFLEVVESTLQTKIPIPEALNYFLLRKKESLKCKSDFDSFKNLLQNILT